MKMLFFAILISSQPSLAKNLIKETKLKTGKSTYQVVVEIPSGTNAKWEANKQTGLLEHDKKNGKKRYIQYLPYPFNYGFFPQTLLKKHEGGDGDPLDVAIISNSKKRGTVLNVRPLGVLVMKDRDEIDDKILAVEVDSKVFKNVYTLQDLNSKFPGISNIVETWFNNYKGQGKMENLGWKDEKYAVKRISVAAKSFKKHSK